MAVPGPTTGGRSVAQGSIKRNPATELSDALITGLTEMPFLSAKADRLLLLQLIKRNLDDFPDIRDNDVIRSHFIEMVLACHQQPGGFRALTEALTTMAPHHPGVKNAIALVKASSVQGLIPDLEMRRIFDSLRRAEAEIEPSVPLWWWDSLDKASISVPADTPTLAEAFSRLCAGPARGPGTPPALRLLRHVAELAVGQLRAELDQWARSLADRLEVDAVTPPGSTLSSTAVTSPPDSGNSVDQPEHPPHQSLDHPDDKRTETAIIPANSDKSGDTGANGLMRAEYNIPLEERTDLVDSDASPLGVAMPAVAPTQISAPLPKVWGDIPQKNPNFTGREPLLEDLHEKLSRTHQTAVLPQALHGMGGVGKSQVAVEYVHRNSSAYDLIWWIPAQQESQIRTSLTQLALRLGLDVSPEASIAVPAVREALSNGSTGYRNWLLVFDNAEAPQEVLRYFPSGGAGKILVTSRDLDWSRVTRSIDVDVFTREESKTFLRGRNPELTDEAADRLAEALGDLPLAIEQAAAWRAATGMPVADYLTLLEQRRIEILEASPSPDYPDSVAAAFQLSLDKLKAVNPAALQMLQVCSFFAPEPIAREFFAGSPVAQITDELDEMLSDSLPLSRAIRDINKYALAKIDHQRDTLQIHRLVQAVLIGRMTADERLVMRKGAHTLLANNKPSSPNRRADWPRYQALQPHVVVSRAVESPDPRVQQLVEGIVKFLYYWGDHTGSEARAEEALEWWRKLNGPAAQRTLEMARWLAWMRRKNGKHAAARDLNGNTFALYQEHFGDRDEGTLNAKYAVAIGLQDSGEFTEANRLVQQTLDVARSEFTADDPTTLIFAHALGVSLRLIGDFKAARELDEDTLRRREIVLGSNDPETLNTLAGLLIDLRESGDFVETLPRFDAYYRRTFESFHQDAPPTLQAARYLAISLRKAGDHPGARRLAKDTLDRYRRRYGDDFPETIATAVNYAIDLRQAGELEASKSLATDTLKRHERMFGPRHSHTLSARTNLAIVYRLSGEPEVAYRHDQETLEILNETLGPDHPVTLTCATNFASDAQALGRFKEAYERDTDTLTRSERVLGRDHPSTLAVGVNLALDLRALDRPAEGDRILSGTLTRMRAKLGEQHPATLNALRSIRADCDIDPMPL
jgi:hypothetical protein